MKRSTASFPSVTRNSHEEKPLHCQQKTSAMCKCQAVGEGSLFACGDTASSAGDVLSNHEGWTELSVGMQRGVW